MFWRKFIKFWRIVILLMYRCCDTHDFSGSTCISRRNAWEPTTSIFKKPVLICLTRISFLKYDSCKILTQNWMKRLVGFLYVLASLGWTLFGPSFGFLLLTSSCPPRKFYRGDLWAALKPVKKFKNKVFSDLNTKVKM